MLVSAWVGIEDSVELAGDVSNQAAFHLRVGLALRAAPLGIGAGSRVVSQVGQDNNVEGLVELAVARAVELLMVAGAANEQHRA